MFSYIYGIINYIMCNHFYYMIPGSKGLKPPVLAQRWCNDLGIRPNMSIKVERKLHDMRIVGRIVGVHCTKQSVGIIVGGFPQHLILYDTKNSTTLYYREKTVIIKSEKKKQGFTLVELIVVLTILAILAALLIPALTGYIRKAKE